MKKEINLFDKYPLTELLRLVNKAIVEGADEFSFEKETYYNNDEYKLIFSPK